ncbi:S-adenosylmethionine decarboxylase [Ramicandelaber brevisporus]|nr:S-adenosylmethionine decarboxylase [Ramicandelaber brevisporus]
MSKTHIATIHSQPAAISSNSNNKPTTTNNSANSSGADAVLVAAFTSNGGPHNYSDVLSTSGAHPTAAAVAINPATAALAKAPVFGETPPLSPKESSPDLRAHANAGVGHESIGPLSAKQADVSLDTPRSESPISEILIQDDTIESEAAADAPQEEYSGCFEGPEKLLEIWFASSPAQMQQLIDAAPGTAPAPAWHAEDLNEFTQFRESGRASGLRRVPRRVWRSMLDLVHCQVLSVISDADADAYLLSESSFFVFPHKIVLKTCGTTTLLYALPRMLEIVRQLVVGFDNFLPMRIFYSRKSFMFPDQQRDPHRDWSDEVRYLDKYAECKGSAYQIGRSNGDHWFLYLTQPRDLAVEYGLPAISVEQASASHSTAAAAPHMARVNSNPASPTLRPVDDTQRRHAPGAVIHRAVTTDPEMNGAVLDGLDLGDDNDDVTIEILMTELCQVKMANFYQDKLPGGCPGLPGGRLIEKVTGLNDIYPTCQTDSYMFTPCGFSLNGLEQGGQYYTIHVTPEPQCSYASFETTIRFNKQAAGGYNASPQAKLQALVRSVVDIFGPNKFTVTVFKSRPDAHTAMELLSGSGHSRLLDAAANEAAETRMDGATFRKRLAAVAASLIPPIDVGPVDGYVQADRILYELPGYWLRFAHFEATTASA